MSIHFGDPIQALKKVHFTGSIQLLRAKDKVKDQSYFLASVSSKAFKDCVFPLGDLHKSEVREIAAAAGLHNAQRHSSVGICFIGRVTYLAAIPDCGTNLNPELLAIVVGNRPSPSLTSLLLQIKKPLASVVQNAECGAVQGNASLETSCPTMRLPYRANLSMLRAADTWVLVQT